MGINTCCKESLNSKDFPAWKRLVCQLMRDKGYLIPGDNWLFVRWERGVTVDECIRSIKSLASKIN